MSHRPLTAVLAIIASALAGALISHAGPLDPPVGPVAPTYKTLTEVEPRIAINAANTPGDADSLYKITKSGSYYLAGDITGVSGKSGIELAASDVTLDLRGFTLTGQAGTLDGIRAPFAVENVTIRNGTITSWDSDGIDVFSSHAVAIEDVRVSRSSIGLRAGIRAVVRRCRLEFNYSDGLEAGDFVVVEDTDSYQNANAKGMRLGVGARLIRCTSAANGSDGVFAGSNAQVSEVLATGNAGNGFWIGDGSSVERCKASGNSGGGFLSLYQVSLSGCTAMMNGTVTGNHGFQCGERSLIVDCTSTQNGLDGFAGTDSITVRGCEASNNARRGISLGNGGQVVGNLTRNNQQDGIYVNYSCNVRENNCNGDGAATGNHGAIRVVGQANRVDGNNISYADRGLMIESGGNAVVRNSVKGCTVNFDIVGGNDVGPIGAAATASSPWANIQF